MQIVRHEPSRLGRLGCAGLLAWSLAHPPPARADAQTIALTPATTTLSMTVYAMGLFPLAGDYPRFHGTLEIDPAQPGFCRVSVIVEQASLHMSDPERVRKALAEDMLDAAHFPTMDFEGRCQGKLTTGTLTLHGVTRPLSLVMSHEGGAVVGEGRLMRRDYAITGMPHLLGQQIKIRFQTTLPML